MVEKIMSDFKGLWGWNFIYKNLFSIFLLVFFFLEQYQNLCGVETMAREHKDQVVHNDEWQVKKIIAGTIFMYVGKHIRV